MTDYNENLCIYAIDSSFYNLKPLINKRYDYNVSLKDQGVSYRVLFNFCQQVKEPLCKDTMAGLLDEASEIPNRKCTTLSSGPGPREGISLIQDGGRSYSTANEKHAKSDDEDYGGLDFIYGSDNSCTAKTFPPNSLRIKLYCDKSVTGDAKVELYKVDLDICEV